MKCYGENGASGPCLGGEYIELDTSNRVGLGVNGGFREALRPDDAYYWATHNGAEIEYTVRKTRFISRVVCRMLFAS